MRNSSELNQAQSEISQRTFAKIILTIFGGLFLITPQAITGLNLIIFSPPYDNGNAVLMTYCVLFVIIVSILVTFFTSPKERRIERTIITFLFAIMINLLFVFLFRMPEDEKTDICNYLGLDPDAFTMYNNTNDHDLITAIMEIKKHLKLDTNASQPKQFTTDRIKKIVKKIEEIEQNKKHN